MSKYSTIHEDVDLGNRIETVTMVGEINQWDEVVEITFVTDGLSELDCEFVSVYIQNMDKDKFLCHT